jgi:hypothetical protein
VVAVSLVKVGDRYETLARIEAAGETPLAPGTRVIAGGAHFIEDGEPVAVAREVEVRR